MPVPRDVKAPKPSRQSDLDDMASDVPRGKSAGGMGCYGTPLCHFSAETPLPIRHQPE
jgi:hypothetical protein